MEFLSPVLINLHSYKLVLENKTQKEKKHICIMVWRWHPYVNIAGFHLIKLKRNVQEDYGVW